MKFRRTSSAAHASGQSIDSGARIPTEANETMIQSQRKTGRIEHGCCVQCRREVPLTTAIAVAVTKGGEIAGYLHRFHCQGEWQAAHPTEYGYGLPRWKSRR